MPDRALGVDHVTVLGMPPEDFVSLAAEAGCASVSLFPEQRLNPFGFPAWSLVTDAALRREVRLRLDATGLAFALGETGVIAPDLDVGRMEPALDVFCELGAVRASTVCMEPDPAREAEQLRKLAQMTASRGLQLAVEYARVKRRRLQDLAATVAALRPLDVGITIDPMHFFRGGETVEGLAALDPALFVYLQLCDVPLKGEGPYMDEALNERLPPGEGELPLRSLIAALPSDIVISMEVPQVTLARSGVSHLDRLRHLVATSRALMSGRD